MQKKILLLDPDRNFRRTLSQNLRDRGFETIESTTLEEALSNLSAANMTLVIIANSPPIISAIDAVEILRRKNLGLKFIVLTSTWIEDSEHLILCEQHDVEVILNKPIALPMLLRYVEQLVGIILVPLSPEDFASQKRSLMLESFSKMVAEVYSEINDILECFGDSNSYELAHQALRKTRTLSLAAQSFGFPKITATLSAVEQTLNEIARFGLSVHSHQADLGAIRSGFSSITRRLTELVEENEDRTSKMESPEGLPCIVVLTEDNSLPIELSPLRQAFDLDIISLDSPLVPRTDIAGIMVEVSQNAIPRPQELLEKIHTVGQERVPTAIISRYPLCDEAISLYLGTVELPRPVPLDALSWFANKVIETRGTSTVLVIDKDLSVLKRIDAALSYENITMQGFCNAQSIFELLERHLPELLILGSDLDGLSGYDLCKLIRKNDNWSELQIILLLDDVSSWSMRTAVYECGADAYIGKPIVNMELVSRIKHRLKRKRAGLKAAGKDYCTGLLSHAAFVRAVTIAQDNGPISIARVTLTNLCEINKVVGPTLGDVFLYRLAELLSERFRSNDIRGRWGGNSVALACAGVAQAGFEQAMEFFVNEFKERSEIVRTNDIKCPEIQLLSHSSRLTKIDSIYTIF